MYNNAILNILLWSQRRRGARRKVEREKALSVHERIRVRRTIECRVKFMNARERPIQREELGTQEVCELPLPASLGLNITNFVY